MVHIKNNPKDNNSSCECLCIKLDVKMSPADLLSDRNARHGLGETSRVPEQTLISQNDQPHLPVSLLLVIKCHSDQYCENN